MKVLLFENIISNTGARSESSCPGVDGAVQVTGGDGCGHGESDASVTGVRMVSDASLTGVGMVIVMQA